MLSFDRPWHKKPPSFFLYIPNNDHPSRNPSIEEEPIFPIRDLSIESKHLFLHLITDFSEIQGSTQIHGPFQFGSQSLSRVTSVGGRFDQTLDLVSSWRSKTWCSKGIVGPPTFLVGWMLIERRPYPTPSRKTSHTIRWWTDKRTFALSTGEQPDAPTLVVFDQ